MAIAFNAIPINLRVPGVYLEIDNSQAVQGLTEMPTRILVIGQMRPTGSAAPLTPIRILSAEQAADLFGRASMLAHMLAALKAANDFTETWAVGVEDLEAGAAASGALAFTGAASAAGTLNLYIGGRRLRVGVAAADAAADIAAAVAAAINADRDLLVTAEVDDAETSKVNLTAAHKGECGNAIDLRVNYYDDETTPAGVTVTVTAMSGGTGNPDIADIITAIGDEWFTDIVMPWTDAANLAVLVAELTDRFGPLRMIDGHAYAAVAGTHGEISAAGEALNSPHLSMIGYKGSPTPPWEWAAVLAAVCAFNLTQDPARPVQTLALPGLLAPPIQDRFTLAERNLLLYGGISTFRVDAGGTVVIERVITTYRETPFGSADPSLLDIETLKTLTYLRYDCRTYVARKYPRHKLADDGTLFGPGQPIMTPKLMKAELIARFALWEERGLVEGREQFKRDLIVERDLSDVNRLNALIPPDIINQLRVFAGLVQFRL